jgi:NADPH:quinone reductase-like Zn-dependent oxidoreductase
MDTTTTTQQHEGSSSREGSMRTIAQRRYGSDPAAVLELETTPSPTIGAGEVLVRVAAASVDMGTVHVMTGMPALMRLAGFGVRAPKAPNPGRAFAGTVVEVGEDVTGFRPGDEVYGTTVGSFAELVRASVDKVAAKPANLSFEPAAAAPISGVTALQAVRKANIRAGQRVLVVGAAGGVGSFAVQIAKAAGAEVTGVCRTAKVDLVRSLGADHVIDYTAQDFTEGTERYDVILDTGGNRRVADLRRILTKEGTLVIVGGETGGRLLGGFERALGAVLRSPFVSQRLTSLASRENAADLDALRDLIEAGSVVPAIDHTYPLPDVAEAVRRVRDGEVAGKVVIAV